MPDNLPPVIMLVLFCLLWLLVILRWAKNALAPVKTVRAEVIDKQKVTFFSKYKGDGKSVRYSVVFLVAGKKRSFYVSEFSYGGYRHGEKGMLTYKGNRILDFK